MHGFLPMGTGGSRTCNARSAARLRYHGHLVPSFHMSWTRPYEIAPLRTLLKEYVDFRRRPIRFPPRMTALKSSSDFRSRVNCDFRDRVLFANLVFGGICDPLAFGRRSSVRRPAWSSVASDIPIRRAGRKARRGLRQALQQGTHCVCAHMFAGMVTSDHQSIVPATH